MQAVCKTYTETKHESVFFEVVERKCHVEKYTRTVCDGDTADSYASGSYSGSDDYQKVALRQVRPVILSRTPS